jgi:hypothetical protein
MSANTKELEINEEMEQSDIITALLAADADKFPTITVPIERLGIPVKLKALTGKQVSRVRDRNTKTVKTKQGPKEMTDNEGFMIGLISLATVNFQWGAAPLVEKYKASSGDEVIKRTLLAGEIALLGEAVLDVSGYNVELDDIKN